MVFRLHSQFWLDWKNSSSKDTLFLKHFCFSINFTNILKNICVDQVVLKIRVLNQEKNFWSAYGKIPDQGFKSWSTKYPKLEIKSKSWYIHDFFEPVSNNASSISPRVLNQEKNFWSAYSKIPDQGFQSWSTKYPKLEIKNKSWYIHDFFEPGSNNASSTSSFNATVIGYWYFDILTFSLFHKDVSSIWTSKLHSCVLFIIFFPMSKPKSGLIDKIFIENQLVIKPINSPIRNRLFNQMLIFKNWSVYFSSVLGYIRFQQPHNNKKLWFSAVLLD